MKVLLIIFLMLFFPLSNVFIFCFNENEIEQILLLTPRSAGMGFVSTGICSTTDSIRVNPACLPNSSKTLVSHSRSIRHFPFGGKSKFYIGHSKKYGNLPDQLDVDLISIIPQSGRNFSYGISWTIPGEFGYDYGNESLKNIIPEREKVHGSNKIISISDNGKNNNNGIYNGISLSKTKYYHRKILGDINEISNFNTNKFYFYHSEIKNDNITWGVGISLLISNFKKINSIKTTLGFAYTGVNNTLVSFEIEKLFTRNNYYKPLFRAALERTAKSKYSFRLGYFGEKLKIGNLTYGLGLKSGMLNLDYAVVKDFLPQLIGQEIKSFKDIHIIGYSLRL